MNTEDIKPWQTLLDQLGKDIGLEDVGFTEDGYCSLALDNGRVFHLDIQEDGLLMMTVVGEAPTGDARLPMLETLLGANAFWAGTNGATLSLDPELRHVLLMCRHTLAVVETRGLRAVLGELIEASHQWALRLEGGDAVPESDDGDTPPDPSLRV